MKLNHINLVVSNIPEAIKLFETYFNFKCSETKGNNIVAILKGMDNFTLVLMANKNEETYPDAFHIGFMLNNTSAVIETYDNLKNGGITVGQAPGKVRDSFGFYFTFDNLMIEVGHYVK